MEIGHGLVGDVASDSVAGQSLDLIAQPIGVQPLDGLDDPGVQRAPAVCEEAAVGYLVGQRVLEGVLEGGKEGGLVEELRGLKPVEMAPKLVAGHAGDGLEHVELHVGADDRGGLKHALVLGGQTVDPGSEEGLHGGRHLDGVERPQQAVAPAVARQHSRLDQRPDTFLQKERRPLGPLDEEALQRLDGGVVAEQGVQQLARAGRGQGVDPELPVVGLRSPGVLVLRAIVDEHEDARRRQPLHEGVHQGLRLGIDPVQVLEDDDDGLGLALAEEEPLDAVEDLPAALGRVEVLPVGIVGGDVEEPQERPGGTARGPGRARGAGPSPFRG